VPHFCRYYMGLHFKPNHIRYLLIPASWKFSRLALTIAGKKTRQEHLQIPLHVLYPVDPDIHASKSPRVHTMLLECLELVFAGTPINWIRFQRKYGNGDTAEERRLYTNKLTLTFAGSR